MRLARPAIAGDLGLVPREGAVEFDFEAILRGQVIQTQGQAAGSVGHIIGDADAKRRPQAKGTGSGVEGWAKRKAALWPSVGLKDMVPLIS